MISVFSGVGGLELGLRQPGPKHYQISLMLVHLHSTASRFCEAVDYVLRSGNWKNHHMLGKVSSLSLSHLELQWFITSSTHVEFQAIASVRSSATHFAER